MDPKYHIGQIVKVYDYYADMIVKDVFYGLVVGVKSYTFNQQPLNHVYSILSDDERTGVKTAEEFAVETVGVL